MKLLENDAAATLAAVREWRSAFNGVGEALKDVENFLLDPISHAGDQKYLNRIFNSIELLKTTVTLNSQQLKLCKEVYDKVIQVSLHDVDLTSSN